MSQRFTNCGYPVTVSHDRSYPVKLGAWISKYAAAISGDPMVSWECFKKKGGNRVVDLPDPHPPVLCDRFLERAGRGADPAPTWVSCTV